MEKAGFKVKIKGGFLCCYKDEIELDFPLKYYTGNSYLIGVYLIPDRHNYGMITKKHLHNQLGHPSMRTVQKTSRDMGIKLENEDENNCESCALSKAKRVNLRKYNTNPVFNPGNRIYLDTSWIKYPSGGGNNYWVLLVDEFTKMCWSLFIRKVRTSFICY